MVSHSLPQTLPSHLVALGDNPGESSDIHNIQSQSQYDTILDVVFMCAGLTRPGMVELVAHSVSVTICLLVEESLYTLKKAISSYTIFKPSHYLDTEDFVDKTL